MPDQNTLADLTAQLELPSPITQIHPPILIDRGIELFIKRDELIHPIIQGNKWRKLKYNLLEARQQQHHTLLSFGGAYSNHLHALAKAGQLLNFKTIGIIRGEAPQPLNPCLQDMQHWGMQLEFITRKDYRQKTTTDFIDNLKQQFGSFYLIPEGGNNAAGRKGCAELLDETDTGYDYICCEVGSATLFSALIQHNKKPQTQFLGFAVMKNPQLEQQIKNSLSQTPLNIPDNAHCNTDWHIIHDYHFNGFAKTSPQLDTFIRHFKDEFNIQLEPVYSAKMLYGIMDLIERDYFRPGARILAIHGGGLQGLRGFPQFNPD
ncbi:MAG TPA: 1-aminocyclopropane-1-carboxylate deaminase/D-cysteine desulfhydrase [Gammaproteobacteria bacterium]|nr:1-aminocyclopropane-1-carboxylate deaminase/D-cysteine desulfhydrase [Gammaproteobacteria bacterium]